MEYILAIALLFNVSVLQIKDIRLASIDSLTFRLSFVQDDGGQAAAWIALVNGHGEWRDVEVNIHRLFFVDGTQVAIARPQVASYRLKPGQDTEDVIKQPHSHYRVKTLAVMVKFTSLGRPGSRPKHRYLTVPL